MSDRHTELSSLAPTLLLSMPQLVDPNFRRTVVLLCEHGADGAFGLVLNRPTTTRATSVIHLDPPPVRDCGLPVWIGGPVEPQRGWILLAEQPEGVECVRVAEGVYLSTSAELLRRLIESPTPPRARLLTGYAGWGPGQLDAEMAASAWLLSDVDVNLIFDTRPEEMWEQALRRLGVDPAALHMGPGVH